MAVVKDIKAMRAALEANAATAPKLNKATAHARRRRDGAAPRRPSPSGSTSTTATTRCSRGGWAMPFKQLDAALQEYATFLREKVAAADAPVPATPASVPPVQPAPAPKYASVPDLARNHRAAAGRDARHRRALQRRRGPAAAAADAAAAAAARRAGAAPAPPAPDNAFYSAWLDGAEVARLRSRSRATRRWTTSTSSGRRRRRSSAPATVDSARPAAQGRHVGHPGHGRAAAPA